MKCASAVDRMLEADLREISDAGSGELAEHLTSCDRCSHLAEQILAGELGLARELETPNHRISAAEALRVAERSRSLVRRRNAIWQIGGPFAAAASVAAVVLFGNGGFGVENSILTSSPETLPGLEVQSPPGKDVAVFEVANRPDVVVVWFFDAGDD